MKGSLLAGMFGLVIAGCSDHQDKHRTTQARPSPSSVYGTGHYDHSPGRCGYLANTMHRRSRHVRHDWHVRDYGYRHVQYVNDRSQQWSGFRTDDDEWAFYFFGLAVLAGLGYRHRDAIG